MSLTLLRAQAQRYRKFLVAGAGFVGQCLALGLIPAPYDKDAVIALGLLAALGVRQVPNAKAPGMPPAGP